MQLNECVEKKGKMHALDMNNNNRLYAHENSNTSDYQIPLTMSQDTNFAPKINKKHTKVTSGDYCEFDLLNDRRANNKSVGLSINELIREELRLKNLFISLIKLLALFALTTLYNELYLYRFDQVSMIIDIEIFKIYSFTSYERQ